VCRPARRRPGLSAQSQLVAPVLEGQGHRNGCAPPLQVRVTAPMGLRNSRPQTAVRRLSGSGRRSRGTRPCLAAQMPQPCALSASASLSRWPAADAASNCRSVRSSLYAVTALTPSAPAPISSLRCAAQAVLPLSASAAVGGPLPQGGAGIHTLLCTVLCCRCCRNQQQEPLSLRQGPTMTSCMTQHVAHCIRPQRHAGALAWHTATPGRATRRCPFARLALGAVNQVVKRSACNQSGVRTQCASAKAAVKKSAARDWPTSCLARLKGS
jgi:hypothetical protein